MPKRLDFKRLEMLTESQLIEEQREWTASQWETYYAHNGMWTNTIPFTEFDKLEKNKLYQMWKEKYGSNYK